MAIETFGAINALVATNPTATDNVSEGDDHIRGIKATLQTTFPNVTGAITATEAELNILDGVTATTAELNLMDGVTATTAELNYVDGVTSAIQTQLDAKLATCGTIATATITTLGSTTGNITTVNSTTVNATTVDLGNWTVTEAAGVLKFATGGVNKAKLDASGNLTVVGDITAFGTI